jgi:hypothetical protein
MGWETEGGWNLSMTFDFKGSYGERNAKRDIATMMPRTTAPAMTPEPLPDV